MTTYYMRADGSAANKAAASGPGATQANCMNVSVHNAETFSAGDEILLCDDGGIFRASIEPPSSGSDGSRIVYKPESGDSPKAYGSVLAATWADQTGNKWKADIGATAPRQVWFSKASVISWGIPEVSSAALTAEYEWWYDGSQFLWCYSTSDPDSAYDWIEASQRDQSFLINSKNYVEVSGDIELAYSGKWGVKVYGSTGSLVDALTIHHISIQDDSTADGVHFQSCNSCTVSNCLIYDAGSHGIFMFAQEAGSYGGNIAEKNTVYNCYHTGIDMQNITTSTYVGDIIRFNLIYATAVFDDAYAMNGIYLEAGGGGDTIDDTQIYYNVIRDIPDIGIQVADWSVGTLVYNNTICRTLSGATGTNSGIVISTNSATSAIKNNIAINMDDNAFVVRPTLVSVCDNNLWYKSSGNIIYDAEGDTSYTSAQFATYQSDTSLDANGLSEDPLMLDPDNQNFRLQSGSPCIETGVDVGLTLDYEGKPLGRGTNPDIGAFETLKGGPRGL